MIGDDGSCCCGRLCCTSSPCCTGFGRCTGNFMRTIPWFSIFGFVFGIAGAATCFSGLDDFYSAVRDYTDSGEAYQWFTAFLWVVAFLDIMMLIAGVFSTGRCREWCCRTPPGRTKGKCSCRSCCRTSYPLTSTLTFILFIIIVFIACLGCMVILAVFAVKTCLTMICDNAANITPAFTLDMRRFYFGIVIDQSNLPGLCLAIDDKRQVLLRFWIGACAFLIAQVAVLLAIVANYYQVNAERATDKLPPSLSGSSWHAAKHDDTTVLAFSTPAASPDGKASKESRKPASEVAASGSTSAGAGSGVVKEVAMTRNPVYPHRGKSFSSVVSATATGKAKVTEIGNWA